jgi:hypothetical protein
VKELSAIVVVVGCSADSVLQDRKEASANSPSSANLLRWR